MSDISRNGRGLQILGVSLALLNVLLWFSVPAIRAFVDETTGRSANPHNPQIIRGVQELLVYFAPGLALGVFPIVYTAGFAAIPFLKKASPVRTDSRPGAAYSVVISLMLIALESVWILLIAVEIFLRGPNWNIFWPGEQWTEWKLVATNTINLSDQFWLYWMGQTIPRTPWAMRELPGLALIGGYLLVGTALAYALFRRESRTTPYWRWTLLVLLLQIASLVPFKIIWRWAFNVRYWIVLPGDHWYWDL